MAFRIKGTMTGQRQLFGKLDGFKASLQRKILRKAVTQAAKPVRDQVKVTVPTQSGLYRKSIGIRIEPKPPARYVALIGARTGFKRQVTVVTPRGTYKQMRNPAYYAHFVEFDVKAHAIGKGSSLGYKGKRKTIQRLQRGAGHPGYKGLHPLQRAWDQTQDKALAIMIDRIAEEVRKL